jgi:predicted kinase
MLRQIRRLLGLKKTLYLIRGISGTGKSELARALTRFEVAADDMPGMYVDGEYQAHLQKQSHQWCYAQVEDWMGQGRRKIAVHNTFCKAKYFEDYLALAQDYSYAVQIIHAEGIMLEDGSTPKNVHNVSAEVLQRQRENWQPLGE